MKKTLIIIFVFIYHLSNAQEMVGIPKNKFPVSNKRISAVYVEFIGAGLIYSVNYDFRFKNSNLGAGMRIGAGGFSDGKSTFYSFPLGFNYLLGKKIHAFEVGVGGTFTNLNTLLNSQTPNVVGNLTLAYRHQPINDGFSLRIAFMQMFGSEQKTFFIIPWGGISFGYAF